MREYIPAFNRYPVSINMKKDPKAVVQLSITMERQLKERYAKLAVAQDLTLSQLIRLALRRYEQGTDAEKLHKRPD